MDKWLETYCWISWGMDNVLTTEKLAAFQEEPFYMELFTLPVFIYLFIYYISWLVGWLVGWLIS